MQLKSSHLAYVYFRNIELLGPLSVPLLRLSSVQLLSHVRLFVTPELQYTRPPVHHQLPEFTQIHIHQVSDAIQPSHPLSPSPPAPNPSQHQSLLQ